MVWPMIFFLFSHALMIRGFSCSPYRERKKPAQSLVNEWKHSIGIIFFAYAIMRVCCAVAGSSAGIESACVRYKYIKSCWNIVSRPTEDRSCTRRSLQISPFDS